MYRALVSDSAHFSTETPCIIVPEGIIVLPGHGMAMVWPWHGWAGKRYRDNLVMIKDAPIFVL